MVYGDLSDGTAAELLNSAVSACEAAYAPYSDFRVGAALLCKNDIILTGCNVENASYGLTVCAERVALFTAVADSLRMFRAMAIVASENIYPYPCGACLQVMAEFCPDDFTVYVAPASNIKDFSTFLLRELLPHNFNLRRT